jgi:tungstate transport system substrate-binding protein
MLVMLVSSCAASSPDRIVVAAGTTIVDAGLVDRLVDDYLDGGPDVDISVVGGSTAEVLELGARGSADLLITHQVELEEAFLAEHPRAVRAPVFASTFLLVGPPAQQVVTVDSDVVDALGDIARAEATFITRADGSGTSAKEQQLWSLAVVEPAGSDWYVETGQGMGFTLQVADQRSGITLTEEGAFLTSNATLSLESIPVSAPPGLLDNPYRSIVVDPQATPGAAAFAGWLVSPEGRAALERANAELYGTVVYRSLS